MSRNLQFDNTFLIAVKHAKMTTDVYDIYRNLMKKTIMVLHKTCLSNRYVTRSDNKKAQTVLLTKL